MECYDAQATISEALDGTAPDAATLEAAKQHCRDCADCVAFVRALDLIQRAPLPEPPADLADRVMEAVRLEVVAEQALAAEQARSVSVAAAAPETPGQAIGVTPEIASVAELDSTASSVANSRPGAEKTTPFPLSRGQSRPRPAVLAAWMGAAALLVVSAGTVGVMGIRVMSQERSGLPSQADVNVATVQRDAGSAVQPAAPPPAESTPASSGGGASVSAGPNYIVFKQTAYRLVGPSSSSKGQMASLGTITTSLGGGDSRSRNVLGTTGAPGVYVENDQGELLEFQPLERTFEGRTYRLRSADLPAFGAWPAMPSGITQPTSADGSPTFSVVSADPSGVKIYRLTSSTVSEGIAVAPSTSASDAAGGNPNWTWWTPAP
ncbi:MAG: hypothetical protein WCJ13_02940 [Coriobacteriia bacterium]